VAHREKWECTAIYGVQLIVMPSKQTHEEKKHQWNPRKFSSYEIQQFNDDPGIYYCELTILYNFFSRIRKRFVYHCIKEKSLKKHTTRFYRAPKEVDLTQPKLDHPNKRPHDRISLKSELI